jgi:hypothetical protein
VALAFLPERGALASVGKSRPTHPNSSTDERAADEQSASSPLSGTDGPRTGITSGGGSDAEATQQKIEMVDARR